MFKSERMKLEEVINTDERRQDCRKKLLKFMEENGEIPEYINYLTNKNVGLGVMLGILLSCIAAELVLLGIILG